MRKISADAIYSAIVASANQAESISWHRFHNFLIANSVLVLGWAAIYVSSADSQMVTIVLLAICALGGLSGVFFAALGKRGREFVGGYVALGKELEANPSLWPEELGDSKLLTKSADLRDKLPHGWSGSRYLLKFGPLSFTVLYIVLSVASLLR